MTLESTDIEKQVTELLETPFEQPEFEQNFGNLISKKSLLNATGSAISGTVVGMIPQQFIGMIPFGLAPVVVGLALKKTVAKTGLLGDLADGIVLGGLATTISRFLPTSFMPQAEVTAQEEKEPKIDGVMW
jgi:hypothetical protein